MKVVDFRDFQGDYRLAMPRAELDVEQAVAQVRPICAAVQEQGITALLDFAEQFDGIRPPYLRVPQTELDRALAELDPEIKAAFAESIRRRQAVCEIEVEESLRRIEVAPGAVIEQKLIPVSRVGLYVPGGLSPLASSVLMNVIPAQAAGVKSIAVTSPPQKEFGGLPHPNILAICAMLGVDEVYAVGGAQAIAMFAYGVPGLCDRADMVSGPGNIYVVAAKRLLRGLIGIDSEAGPTEIAILADRSANAKYVAADLIGQAEHDPMAGSVLVTDSPELIAAVNEELPALINATKHQERIRTALTGPQSALLLVRDLAQGIEVVDAYAAEHLEIHTENPYQVAHQIQNAGAIFIGAFAPVPLGDYSAGSTHVLPTGGCACHSSGLNVKSFYKAVHLIDYSQPALAEIASVVERFAAAEDLPAHGMCVAVRRPDFVARPWLG